MGTARDAARELSGQAAIVADKVARHHAITPGGKAYAKRWARFRLEQAEGTRLDVPYPPEAWQDQVTATIRGWVDDALELTPAERTEHKLSAHGPNPGKPRSVL